MVSEDGQNYARPSLLGLDTLVHPETVLTDALEKRISRDHPIIMTLLITSTVIPAPRSKTCDEFVL